MYALFCYNVRKHTYSPLPFMHKSLVVEGLLVVAIVSAVGYGTVVIRAMGEPVIPGIPQEVNQSGQDVWTSPPLIAPEGGSVFNDVGFNDGGGDYSNNSSAGGASQIPLFESWQDIGGQLGVTPSGGAEIGGTQEVELLYESDQEDVSAGYWTDGDNQPTFDGETFPQADGQRIDARNDGISSYEAQKNDADATRNAQDAWFNAARERLMRSAEPEEVPGDGVTESVSPGGQGAIEESFSGGYESDDGTDENVRYDFGVTDSGDDFGDNAEDDTIWTDESSDEEYGPDQYNEREASVEAAFGLEGWFNQFLWGNDTDETHESEPFIDESGIPEESPSTDSRVGSAAGGVVEWVRGLFGF